MEIKSSFDHFNIDITDIERSVDFYRRALGLKVISEKRHPGGDFVLTYLASDEGSFRLELTWLRDHPQPFELGENESHLAMRVSGDYDRVREYHRSLGVICYENPEMGIYFIHDPDDYWIEILPEK